MDKKRKVNKKLEKIKNAKIISRVEHHKDLIYLHFDFDVLIEPSPRPRVSRIINKFYDPLDSYKKYIRKEIEKYVKPYYTENEVKMEIYLTFPPVSTMSKKTILYAIRDIIKPLKKPDIDNVSKTIMDIFNKFLYIDDSHITSLHISKHYGTSEHTGIVFILNKNKNEIKGRINKNDKITAYEENFIEWFWKNKKKEEEVDYE